MGTLCAQFPLEFYTDQFETLQALLSWSVDVHKVLALSSIKFLSLFWGVLKLAISVHLSVMLCKSQKWLELGCWNFVYSISMKNKQTHISSFFPSRFSLYIFPIFDLGIWRQMVDTLCAQLLIQFYTDQFETLHALLSWSVDVHVFWHGCQFNFCHLFSAFALNYFWGLKYYSNALPWVPCLHNSSYSFIPINLKFCRPFCHGLYITKTCLYGFDPLKPHFHIVKLGFTGIYIIFLISAKKILEIFIWIFYIFFLVVKFSVYFNRQVFVIRCA